MIDRLRRLRRLQAVAPDNPGTLDDEIVATLAQLDARYGPGTGDRLWAEMTAPQLFPAVNRNAWPAYGIDPTVTADVDEAREWVRETILSPPPPDSTYPGWDPEGRVRRLVTHERRDP